MSEHTNGRDKASKAGIYATLASGYSEVLGGYKEAEAIFLTCNSTLTEVLRGYLIRATLCTRIYEIMHGVGSIQAEAFFANVLSGGREFGAHQKHYFIPQLPNLPLYGVFKAQALDGGHLAINAYMNQTVTAWGGLRACFEEEFRSECETLLAGQFDQIPLIVSILGNYPYDGKLYDSPSFKVECLLVALIDEIAKDIGKKLILIYVPHPSHGNIHLSHPILSQHKVTIRPNSVFSWLISDLCIAVFSSTTFEAAYLGAQAWTPMIPQDNLFPQSYLDLVGHPDSPSVTSLVASLRHVMLQCAGQEHENIIARARMRLERAGYQ